MNWTVFLEKCIERDVSELQRRGYSLAEVHEFAELARARYQQPQPAPARDARGLRRVHSAYRLAAREALERVQLQTLAAA